MYPRLITIDSDKLKKLMLEKGALVEKGRAVSVEIDALEIELEEINKTLIEEEKKVDISDISEKEKAVTVKVEDAIAEMKVYKQEIFDRMTAQMAPELRNKYEEVKKNKEDKETERNKIALKAQKYNDKIIPLSRGFMKPFLQDQYEDYDSLYLEDDVIIASIFSHIVDFKTNFKKK